MTDKISFSIYCGGGAFGIDPAIHRHEDFLKGPYTHFRSETSWSFAVALNLAKHGHPTTMHCLPLGELLLTKFGGKTIDQIDIGDNIIGCSVDNVEDTFCRFYDGKVFEIKGMGLLPFKVTEDHPIYVAEGERTSNKGKTSFSINKKLFVLARNLQISRGSLYEHPSRQFLVFPKFREQRDIRKLTASTFYERKKWVRGGLEYIPINEDIAELAGYYLAEGSAARACCLSFSAKERSLVERSKYLLEKYFPFKLYIVDRGTSIDIRFGGTAICRFFKFWFGDNAKEKRIPYWILFNNKEILSSFLNAYFLGDGFIHQNKITRWKVHTTSSKLLALQLQLAFSKLDCFAPIIYEPISKLRQFPTRQSFVHDRYRIYVNLYTKVKHFKEDKENFYLPIRHIIEHKYSGLVYNLKTNSGVFLISNILSHNCPWGDIQKYPPPENVKISSLGELSGIHDVLIHQGFDETERYLERIRNCIYKKCINLIGGGPRKETFPRLWREDGMAPNHCVARPNRCYEEEYSQIPFNRAVYCPHPCIDKIRKPNTDSKMMLWANRGAWASDSYAPYSEKVLSFMEANPEYHYHVLLFSDIRKYAPKSIVDRFEALPNKTLDEPYYGVFHDEFLELLSKSKILLSNGNPGCNPAIMEAATHGCCPLVWNDSPYKKEAVRFGFDGTDGIRHILRNDSLFREYHAALAEASYDYTEDGAYTIFMNELKRIGLEVE